MAKTKKPLKRLPKSSNGTQRRTSSFGAYEYQKDELRKRASQKGCTVSYYMNLLLWSDWLHEQEKRVK